MVSVLNQQTNQEEKVEFSFADFIRNNFLLDKVYGGSLALLEESNRLDEQVQGLEPGGVLAMSKEAWERLNKLACQPLQPYGNVRMMRTLLPFLRAINEANEIM